MCALVQAIIPPSTVRFASVMYEDSGPATNATSAKAQRDLEISLSCSALHPKVGRAVSPVGTARAQGFVLGKLFKRGIDFKAGKILSLPNWSAGFAA
jgi:hypothetical protein